jgi:hypothetical protein
MTAWATRGPARFPVAMKIVPKSRPMTPAQSIHPHRAGPRIWWSDANAIDDATTPTRGTRRPRKKSSSPAALAKATARRAPSPAPLTTGRSAVCNARAQRHRRTTAGVAPTVIAAISNPRPRLRSQEAAPRAPSQPPQVRGLRPRAKLTPQAAAAMATDVPTTREGARPSAGAPTLWSGSSLASCRVCRAATIISRKLSRRPVSCKPRPFAARATKERRGECLRI